MNEQAADETPETCKDCGKKLPKDQLIFGPDPFQSEIHDDYTEVWLCPDCHYESGQDI